jgi:hypothetical protein
LELVRKQLEEDGRKTELLGNGQTDKGKWNGKRWEPLMTGKAGGRLLRHGSREKPPICHRKAGGRLILCGSG